MLHTNLKTFTVFAILFTSSIGYSSGHGTSGVISIDSGDSGRPRLSVNASVEFPTPGIRSSRRASPRSSGVCFKVERSPRSVSPRPYTMDIGVDTSRKVVCYQQKTPEQNTFFAKDGPVSVFSTESVTPQDTERTMKELAANISAMMGVSGKISAAPSAPRRLEQAQPRWR